MGVLMHVFTVRVYPNIENTDSEDQEDQTIESEIKQGLKEGRARFGWGEHNLSDLKKKDKKGLLSEVDTGVGYSEKKEWNQARFILDVRPEEDYWIYLPSPSSEDRKVFIVKITSGYIGNEIWTAPNHKVFRSHLLRCKIQGEEGFPIKYLREKCPKLKKYLTMPPAHFEIKDKEAIEEFGNFIKQESKI